jgi:hypothetical protein
MKPGNGKWKLENGIGNWKIETAKRKLEIGNRKTDT